jgi:hypothetical protein
MGTLSEVGLVRVNAGHPGGGRGSQQQQGVLLSLKVGLRDIQVRGLRYFGTLLIRLYNDKQYTVPVQCTDLTHNAKCPQDATDSVSNCAAAQSASPTCMLASMHQRACTVDPMSSLHQSAFATSLNLAAGVHAGGSEGQRCVQEGPVRAASTVRSVTHTFCTASRPACPAGVPAIHPSGAKP